MNPIHIEQFYHEIFENLHYTASKSDYIFNFFWSIHYKNAFNSWLKVSKWNCPTVDERKIFIWFLSNHIGQTNFIAVVQIHLDETFFDYFQISPYLI